MKISKKIMTLIIVLVGILYVNVSATMNEPFVDTSVGRKDGVVESLNMEIPTVSTAVYKNGLATVYIEPIILKDNRNHYFLYNIEPNEMMIDGNELYKYKGEIVDPGLIYLVKNGYPNKTYNIRSGAAYPDKSVEMNNYTVTQLAIWIYNHEVWGMTYPKYDILDNKSTNAFYADLVTKAKDLADAAKEVHNREWDNGSRVIPAMSNPSVTTTTLKVVNNSYLLSEEITVPTTMLETYTVSVDKGIVVDTDDNVKNTFNAGEKFRIKYTKPESVTINVTIKSNSSYDHMYAYKNYTNQEHMDLLLAVLQNEKQNFTKTLKLTYSNDNKVRISNQNSITGAELAGTTLVVKDQANNIVVNPFVTTTNPKEVTLDPGTYYLYETIATSGYKLNTEPVKFTVRSDGTLVSPLIMLNEPLKGLKVEYVDGNTGDPLPGANLVIKQNGSIINTIITKNTFSYISLQPGEYTLEETKPAPGYANANQVFNFTVDSNGVTDTIKIDSWPLKGFSVTLLEKGTTNSITGATLSIERSDGTEVATWTTTEDSYHLYLQEGTYFLVEKEASSGYILIEEKKEIKVDRFGEADDVIIYNEPEVVPVPITSKNRTLIIALLSLILISCGSLLLAKGKKA